MYFFHLIISLSHFGSMDSSNCFDFDFEEFHSLFIAIQKQYLMAIYHCKPSKYLALGFFQTLCPILFVRNFDNYKNYHQVER